MLTIESGDQVYYRPQEHDFESNRLGVMTVRTLLTVMKIVGDTATLQSQNRINGECKITELEHHTTPTSLIDETWFNEEGVDISLSGQYAWKQPLRLVRIRDGVGTVMTSQKRRVQLRDIPVRHLVLSSYVDGGRYRVSNDLTGDRRARLGHLAGQMVTLKLDRDPLSGADGCACTIVTDRGRKIPATLNDLVLLR